MPADSDPQKVSLHPIGVPPAHKEGGVGTARRASGGIEGIGLEVSEEPISERCEELRRSVQLGRSACFSSSGWTMSIPYLFHTQMAKVEL